jgi:hypothetical protein
MTPQEFTVGVFEHPRKRSVMLMAYTRYFNPSWEGCCVHKVLADNGDQAKAIAIGSHRELCMVKKP